MKHDNSDNNKIFTSHFRGSIDQLLNFCSSKADFVSDVFDGKTEVHLSDEELLEQMQNEFPDFNTNNKQQEEEALYDQMREQEEDETSQLLQEIIDSGDIELVGYDKNGQGLYSITEQGRKSNEELLRAAALGAAAAMAAARAQAAMAAAIATIKLNLDKKKNKQNEDDTEED